MLEIIIGGSRNAPRALFNRAEPLGRAQPISYTGGLRRRRRIPVNTCSSRRNGPRRKPPPLKRRGPRFVPLTIGPHLSGSSSPTRARLGRSRGELRRRPPALQGISGGARHMDGFSGGFRTRWWWIWVSTCSELSRASAEAEHGSGVNGVEALAIPRVN